MWVLLEGLGKDGLGCAEHQEWLTEWQNRPEVLLQGWPLFSEEALSLRISVVTGESWDKQHLGCSGGTIWPLQVSHLPQRPARCYRRFWPKVCTREGLQKSGRSGEWIAHGKATNLYSPLGPSRAQQHQCRLLTQKPGASIWYLPGSNPSATWRQHSIAHPWGQLFLLASARCLKFIPSLPIPRGCPLKRNLKVGKTITISS